MQLIPGACTSHLCCADWYFLLCEGTTNGVEGKSKQALKRARAKARKAATAEGSVNGSPMLSRSQSGASSDSSQPFVARAPPLQEVSSLHTPHHGIHAAQHPFL